MEERNDMDSIATVMQYLHEKGYDSEFSVSPGGQLLLKGKLYPAEDVKLIRTFRFEGESDPSEQSILYLVKTCDENVGYSIDSYGMYSQHMNDAYSGFIDRLSS